MIPHQDQAEKLLEQFEEVNILNVRLATNAKGYTLAGQLAFLSIPEGETRSILVTGRRLLIPLLETLPESGEDFNVEVTTEAAKDWRILFLIFSNLEDSLSSPQEG